MRIPTTPELTFKGKGEKEKGWEMKKEKKNQR